MDIDKLTKSRDELIRDKDRKLPIRWFDLETHSKTCECATCKVTGTYKGKI